MRRVRVFLAAFAGVLLLTLASAPARGQPLPPDVVVMTNGDRLTGEIKSLSKGRLSLDVGAIGIVSIKWEQVAAVTAGRLFEVETTGGVRLPGALASAGTGQVVVTGDAGQVTLPLGSVVGLVPIYRSFLRRLDGSISIGGNYTQSSGVAQLSLAFAVTARRPSFEWRLSADDYVTLKSDGATTQRVSANIGYSRYLSNRWAIFGGGQIERNPELGFDVRGTVGGGLERTLVRTNRSDLVVRASSRPPHFPPVSSSLRGTRPEGARKDTARAGGAQTCPWARRIPGGPSTTRASYRRRGSPSCRH